MAFSFRDFEAIHPVFPDYLKFRLSIPSEHVFGIAFRNFRQGTESIKLSNNKRKSIS
jgi:hypothetical protein